MATPAAPTPPTSRLGYRPATVARQLDRPVPGFWDVELVFQASPVSGLPDRLVTALLGALALALAIGVAVGLDGREYVAENIDEWADSATETVTESSERSE